MWRVGDRLLEILALIAAGLLLFFLLQQWQSLSRNVGTDADTGVGLGVSDILGPSLQIEALHGQTLTLSGESADLLMPEMGPFQVNLAPRALQLDAVEVRLGQEVLHLRADRCRIDAKALLFSGAVRLETAEGKGLLFTDQLELSLSVDLLRTGELAILAPEGLAGGKGGRAVRGFSASLAELLDRSR